MKKWQIQFEISKLISSIEGTRRFVYNVSTYFILILSSFINLIRNISINSDSF